jgi:hypothetical protein
MPVPDTEESLPLIPSELAEGAAAPAPTVTVTTLPTVSESPVAVLYPPAPPPPPLVPPAPDPPPATVRYSTEYVLVPLCVVAFAAVDGDES